MDTNLACVVGTPSQPTCQLWISLLAAFGTYLAVLVALFKDVFLAKVYPPRLILKLKSELGEATIIPVAGSNYPARYFHLNLSNKRPGRQATNAQIYLLSIEEQNELGDYHPTWTSIIPIRWRYHDVNPLAKTIGTDTDADLCSIVKAETPYLRLHTVLATVQSGKQWTGKANLILTFQAKSDEAYSEATRIKIAWDGKWMETEHDVKQHFRIEYLSSQPLTENQHRA